MSDAIVFKAVASRLRREPKKEAKMKRPVLIAGIAVTLFAALFVVEQVRSTEPFEPWNLALDVAETMMLVGAIVLTAMFSVETREMRRERSELLRDLSSARTDSERWRQQARTHVDGLSKAIADQFQTWALTEAETDVAALMLKGLAHKEIASLRSSSEATVRQHAAVVYRKSGLTSRTQLSAFFFEDLLGPAEADKPRFSPEVIEGRG